MPNGKFDSPTYDEFYLIIAFVATNDQLHGFH